MGRRLPITILLAATAAAASHSRTDEDEPAGTCDSECAINGATSTCLEAIKESSLLDFLGEVDSCRLAHESVVAQCPACRGCSAKEAGCGIIEPPKSTLPPPSAHPCRDTCEIGRRSASCEARILWVAQHLYQDSDLACLEARKVVVSQCAICTRCPLAQTSCDWGTGEEPKEDDADGADKNELEDREIDCSGDEEDWSYLKRRRCQDVMESSDDFPRKFDARLGAEGSELNGGRDLLQLPALAMTKLSGFALPLLLILALPFGVLACRRSPAVAAMTSSRLAYAEVPFETRPVEDC